MAANYSLKIEYIIIAFIYVHEIVLPTFKLIKNTHINATSENVSLALLHHENEECF